MNNVRVNQGELAKLLKVDHTRISRLVSRGVIELEADDGKIDYEKALKAIEADGTLFSKPQSSKKDFTAEIEAAEDTGEDQTAAAMPTSFQKSRALREHYAAQREKTKHEVETGALIDSEGTRRAVTSILAALVQSLDKIPDRAAAELPDEYHHETRLSIRREIDRAMLDCRKRLEKLLPKEATQ